jgi:hypothetical protein
MRLLLTASADTTIYKRYPTINTGLDEIVEVGKVAKPEDLEIAYSSSAARALINFTLPVSGTIPETASFYLNLKIANAQKLPYTQQLDIYEISGSWVEGGGYFVQQIKNPQDGATWSGSNAATSASWVSLGGDYYASPSQSIILSEYPLQDLRIDVSTIMQSVLTNNRSFKGLLIKFPSASEADMNNEGNIKFFSRQTHTVHEPILEVVWNTNTFSTGSLKTISNTYDIEVVPQNPKETYIRGSKERVRFVVRDKYPRKNFDATLRYKNVYYLPTSSYFSIVDRQAGIVVSPADQFAKLDCDATGSYFVLDTSNLYKNRNYAVNLEIDNGSSDKNIIPEIFTFWVK